MRSPAPFRLAAPHALGGLDGHHRVLAAGSGPGGFSAEGGVATKLRMLQIEKARFGPEPGLFD